MTTQTETPTRVVRRTAVVDAPPAAVFALLADPSRHPELDGTGTVKALLEGPDRLHEGAAFRMQMKGYRTDNVVVEYAPGERIAWRHRGRHVWRWTLEAAGAGTRVTEEFDWSAKRAPRLVAALGVPARAGKALDATLERLVAHPPA